MEATPIPSEPSIVPSVSLSPSQATLSGIPVVASISPSPSATLSAMPTASVSAQLGGGLLDLNPCPKNSQFIVLCNLKMSQLGPYISTLVTIALVIAVIISLFSLLWGGLRWIISGGDKAKVAAARSGVFSAIIGLIIVFLAYFILSLVLGFFGLSLTKLTLPPLPK